MTTLQIENADELIADQLPESLGFVFDEAGGGYVITWGGYEYPVDLERIPTPLALLEWLAHIADKEWPEATGYRLSRFIESVCRRKGWVLWANH